jgi:hypothetical protein
MVINPLKPFPGWRACLRKYDYPSCLLKSSSAGRMNRAGGSGQSPWQILALCHSLGDYGYHQVCLNGNTGEDIARHLDYFDS